MLYSYCYDALQLQCFLVTVLYSYDALQLQCFTVTVLFSYDALQLRCFTVTMLYSYDALQLRCFTVTVFYSSTVLYSYDAAWGYAQLASMSAWRSCFSTISSGRQNLWVSVFSIDS